MRRIFADAARPAWRETGAGVEFHGLPPDNDLHQRARDHLPALDPGGRLSESDVQLSRAFDAFLRGRRAEALRILDDILIDSPWLDEVFGVRAAAHALGGDLTKAVDDLGHLVHTARENPDIRLSYAHHRRALLRLRVNRGEKPAEELAAAIDDCTEILELEGERAATLTLRGALRADLGRVSASSDAIWSIAESDLNEAVLADEANVDALIERARVHVLRRHPPRDAVNDLQRALAAATSDAARANILTLLAAQYLRIGDARAVDELERAVELDPSYDVAHAALGEALTEILRLQDAIAAFTEALKLTPAYDRARAGRGRALHLRGRLTDALADYDAMTDPPLAARAELRIDMGNLEADAPETYFMAAAADVDAALREEPKNPRLHAIRAAAHHAWWLKVERTAGKTSHLELAADAWTRQTELDKDNADAWQKLGDARFDLARWADAVKAYERAIDLDPARAPAVQPRLDEARRKAADSK